MRLPYRLFSIARLFTSLMLLSLVATAQTDMEQTP